MDIVQATMVFLLGIVVALFACCSGYATYQNIVDPESGLHEPFVAFAITAVLLLLSGLCFRTALRSQRKKRISSAFDKSGKPIFQFQEIPEQGTEPNSATGKELPGQRQKEFGSWLIGLCFGLLVVSRFVVGVFFPEMEGKLDWGQALPFLIPIWSVGLIGLCIWLEGVSKSKQGNKPE